MSRWLVVAMLLGITINAAAQGLGADTERFHVSSNVITSRNGQPAIEGYVTNDSAFVYRRVVLAIEVKDAGGRSMRTALVNLNDQFRPHDRVYFRAALPTTGASYDVRVQSAEAVLGGGM
jgi:hypothetical protein